MFARLGETAADRGDHLDHAVPELQPALLPDARRRAGQNLDRRRRVLAGDRSSSRNPSSTPRVGTTVAADLAASMAEIQPVVDADIEPTSGFRRDGRR
jgi:hypothetical protein